MGFKKSIISILILLASSNLKAQTLRLDGTPELSSAIEVLVKNYSSVKIVDSKNSTDGGLKSLFGGKAEVAKANRSLLDFEKSEAKKPLRVEQVAWEAMAVIVHPQKADAVKSLIRRQLRDIFFTLNLSDWSKIKPNISGKVNLYGENPDVSSNAQAFQQIIAENSYVSQHSSTKVFASPEEVVKAVAQDSSGIGYVPLRFVNSTVSVVSFGDYWEGVAEPKPELIKSGKYKLAKKIYLVGFAGDSASNKFIDFVLSDPSQRVLEASGLVAVK